VKSNRCRHWTPRSRASARGADMPPRDIAVVLAIVMALILIALLAQALFG
jgi:hypothetical protein